MRTALTLMLAGLALGLLACGGVAEEKTDIVQDTTDDGTGGDVQLDVPLDDTVSDEATGSDGDDATGADADLDAPGEEANLPDADARDGEGGTGETGSEGDIVRPDGDGGTPPRCGNGIPESGEECDDGNGVDGDGCNRDCRFSCHVGVPAECPDDGNPCTTERCVTAFVGYMCITEFNTDPCEDGDPCTVEDGCYAGECTGVALPVWYRDEDGDGFGDRGSTLCGWEPGSGWVANPDDCCDALPGVNPAQSAFFPDGYSCPPLPVVSWDFNCDGRDEQRWVGCLICSRDPGGGTVCSVTPGWLPTADGACVPPACGAVGGWAEGPTACMFESGTLSCRPTMAHVGRRQECR